VQLADECYIPCRYSIGESRREFYPFMSGQSDDAGMLAYDNEEAAWEFLRAEWNAQPNGEDYDEDDE
jgi:hypothetical protein